MCDATMFAAGLFARLAMQVGMAQNANGGVIMMHRAGISLPNIAEAGFTHYGLQVENAAQAVARFRKSGVMVRALPNGRKCSDCRSMTARSS